MTTFLDLVVDDGPPRDDGLRKLTAQLSELGLAFFHLRSPDVDALLHLASGLGCVVSHRDSDARGITAIRAKPVPGPGGYGGFSRRELTLHTDRSGAADPPTLLVMLCHRSAAQGGECTFLDGADLFSELAHTDPDLLEALLAPGCATFAGSATDQVASVFSRLSSGRIGIRFRSDELACFAPHVATRLSRLAEVMRDLTFHVRLEPGDGYALQNWRWLHGRTEFAGDREIYRAIVEVGPGSPIERGFRITDRDAAAFGSWDHPANASCGAA